MAKLISEICTAVEKEDFEEVDILLSQMKESQIDLNNQNDTALFYIASMSGTVDILKKFVDAGFPIDSPLKVVPEECSILHKYVGFTGLHFAFDHHRLNAAQFLLSHGANIFIPDNERVTPLHILFKTITPLHIVFKTMGQKDKQKQNSRETYDQMINMILQTNEQKDNNFGVTNLHIACTRDEPEAIEKFLQNEACINQTVGTFFVPEAIENFLQNEDYISQTVGTFFEAEAIEKFLQNEACINQTVGTFFEHEGFSPLHFAAKYNCVKVTKYLLEHGANVNQVNCKNLSALHLTELPELVQLLVQHGADVTLKDIKGNTPLHKAFEERNFKLMDILLSAHLNIHANPISVIGISHFHIACTRNNEDVVMRFLKNGVSINACVFIDPEFVYTAYSYSDDVNWQGCSALHFAAAFNTSKIVKLLLSHKADVNIKDAIGFTALHMGCRSLQERYAEFVMSNSQPVEDADEVDPKHKTKPDNSFDVQNATGSGMFKPKPKPKVDWTSNRQEHVKIIQLLLKHKSDVNCHDKFGNTPVFYTYVWYAFEDAILHEIRDSFKLEMLPRRKSTMTILLRHKVNLDICYKKRSILHYMVEECLHPDLISGYDESRLLEKFLKKGITIDALNEKRLTPLFILVQKTARTDFISLLIRYGANVNFHEPEEHSTLLHVALQNDFDKEQLIFDEVLRGGANPNAQRLDGTTVLHQLAGEFHHYPRIFEKLVGAGVDINARDAKGRTPLFRVCLSWNNGLAKLLLRNGADINIEDNQGNTVLCVMYREKLLSGEISGRRYAEMACNMFDLLLNHVVKKRATVSTKVLLSRGVIIDYLNTHVDKSYKKKHK